MHMACVHWHAIAKLCAAAADSCRAKLCATAAEHVSHMLVAVVTNSYMLLKA
jgi:hypothetical protein